MSARFVCVHGHFYQPPRENPWTGSVGRERSAAPFHDWNERVTAESYRPCTAARLLGPHGRIESLLNVFSRISFNVGPTLMSWLAGHAPDVYERILAADRDGLRRFGGQGGAIAQAYNHVILPLAVDRDRRTQVRWGVRDFEHRFRRRPDGMWLPETAVNVASLEALADAGIRFTILAPHQAARVRPPWGERLADPGTEGPDTTVPYVCRLPSGRSIILFFYDAPLARAVAFERLLDDGVALGNRIAAACPAGGAGERLVHFATDGESYGHHHRHGEMALARALDDLERRHEARPLPYGAFLARQPAMGEAEIREDTAWSCAHGVERWRSACGCAAVPGDPARQAWRAPLRRGLDGLRDALGRLFDEEAGALLRDPWEARDAWIECVLDPSPERVSDTIADRARTPLGAEDARRARLLLESQRHAMLMFTSCGWFFDDVGGIEARQVLRYAARAVDLARQANPGRAVDAAERSLLRVLAAARSSDPRAGDGARIYATERDRNATSLDAAAVQVALGAAADGGGGPPFLPGPDFGAELSVRHGTEEGSGEVSRGEIRIERRPGLEEARYRFVGVRSSAGDVRAGLGEALASSGSRGPDGDVGLEREIAEAGGAEAWIAGRAARTLRPGDLPRPADRREVERRAVTASTGHVESASFPAPHGDPRVDGPIGWRHAEWGRALDVLAAALRSPHASPRQTRAASRQVVSWALGGDPEPGAGKSVRPSVLPAAYARRFGLLFQDALDRETASPARGDGEEEALRLARIRTLLAEARRLGLRLDLWEAQTRWFEGLPAPEPDGLRGCRQRAGRALGFE